MLWLLVTVSMFDYLTLEIEEHGTSEHRYDGWFYKHHATQAKSCLVHLPSVHGMFVRGKLKQQMHLRLCSAEATSGRWLVALEICMGDRDRKWSGYHRE
jgi:hypothetical protein